jgi:hypothetical protein
MRMLVLKSFIVCAVEIVVGYLELSKPGEQVLMTRFCRVYPRPHWAATARSGFHVSVSFMSHFTCMRLMHFALLRIVLF